MIRSAAQHALYQTTAEEKCPLAAREREALGAAGRGERVTVRAMFKFGEVLGCAAALSGCLFSVDPIISASGAIFDSRLLGKWEDVSRSGRIVVMMDSLFVGWGGLALINAALPTSTGAAL